jgi:polysaccharide pyruvyl transferase WcaK-like protein
MSEVNSQNYTFLAQRRLKILHRTKILPRIRKGPTVVQVVVDGKTAPNRGDAAIALATPQIFRSFLPSLNFVQVPIREIRSKPSLPEQIGPCDMVIVGGGGFYGKWFPLERLMPLRDLGVPIVLYALGFNSNFGDDWLEARHRSTIRSLNQFASLSSVRDEATSAFLKSLGFEPDVIADPAAFYFPGIDRSRKKKRSHGLRIGLNLPFHGFRNQAEIMKRALPIISEVLSRWVGDGAEVHYFVHHPGEHELLARFKGLKMVIHAANTDRLLGAYQNVDLVISGMLHSSIFAFSAEVPFLTLAYDSKQQAFSELTGQDILPLKLETMDAESFHLKIADLVRHRTDLKKSLRRKREHLWQAHRDFVERAIALLPQYPLQEPAGPKVAPRR